MMPRNRSRAAESSRAGPCNVSMNPLSAASGVRSSWLTLATKSARISSTRRIGVRSWTVMTTTPERDGTPASAIGATNASDQRDVGNRAENSMRCALPVALALTDRLDQFRHAQRNRGRLAAAQRGSDHPGLSIERHDAPVLIEHHHRIGQTRYNSVEQCDLGS